MDQERPSSKPTFNLEAEVESCRSLRIAADLANGSKHLRRLHHRERAYVRSTDMTVHLEQSKGVDVVHVVTLADRTTVLAQDVAKEACADWDSLLRKHALIF